MLLVILTKVHTFCIAMKHYLVLTMWQAQCCIDVYLLLIKVDIFCITVKHYLLSNMVAGPMQAVVTTLQCNTCIMTNEKQTVLHQFLQLLLSLPGKVQSVPKVLSKLMKGVNSGVVKDSVGAARCQQMEWEQNCAVGQPLQSAACFLYCTDFLYDSWRQRG